MKYSWTQLAEIARKGGFPEDDIPTAVGIALAESGGDPSKHNPKPPDDSYGLWQINMLGPLGPDRRKRFNIKSNTDLFKPEENARVAYAIRKESGWAAWTTYTNGKYLEPAREATRVLTGGAGKGVDEAIDPGNPLEQLLTEVVKARNQFGGIVQKSALQVVGVIAGVVFVVVGLILVFREPAMKLVGSTVGGIVKGAVK